MYRHLGIECRDKSGRSLPALRQQNGTHERRTGINAMDFVAAAAPPAALPQSGSPPASVQYKVHSADGIIPIDRYNVWGWRKRDGVHPFFNAHFALSQLMLNHLCPVAPATTTRLAQAGGHDGGDSSGDSIGGSRYGGGAELNAVERKAPGVEPEWQWAVLRHNVLYGTEYFSAHELNYSWLPEKKPKQP